MNLGDGILGGKDEIRKTLGTANRVSLKNRKPIVLSN